MEIKKDIAWGEVNSLLFSVSNVLEPADRDKLYEHVRTARLGDDARTVAVLILTYIALNLS